MINPSARDKEIARNIFSTESHISLIERIAKACAQARSEEREACLEIALKVDTGWTIAEMIRERGDQSSSDQSRDVPGDAVGKP